MAAALTSRRRTQLGEYRRKRRFDVTSEPEGKVATQTRAREARLAFVVQKHRATALHYDFRLEWRGVMRSWAVPKGPSLDPSVKRMAMEVEDHPLAYNRFEGIIPAGEYGGGTVMIWDRGTWQPESADVDRALEAGELKLTLFGQKLRGSWVLVRLRAPSAQKRVAWLLIKHRDEWADSADVTETEPRSAKSKRLLVEIARDEGGDMKRAADGDPPALLRRILEDLTLVTEQAKRARRKAAGMSRGDR
ncbi:MAG TPA: DNA polymerase ligase N-terminal domain-containing protein [Polyangia bacterium]|nr:DNA polymerase ligase N-terminal domain-containing protein [Polyangia bacterium]